MLDAVIIGAGMGGLAAAVDLAARGKRVAVYEHAPTPGGKVAVALEDGVEFDTGPSLLTWPAVFEELFVRAGTTLAEHVRLIDHDPAFRYVWPDGTTLDMARGREASIESVRRSLGPKAGEELDRFLRYAEGIWNVAAPEFIEHDAPDFFGLLRRGLPGLRAASQIDAFATMRGAIKDRVRSPHLAAILLRFATYTGSDPRRTPATLCSIAHVEMTLGAFGVAGGMIELVRALSRLAINLGASIHCGARVERVLVDGGRACGIALEGGTVIGARCVISNAEVGHLASLLPPTSRGVVQAPEELTTSGVTFVSRARRRSGAAARAAHTVLFSRDVDQEVADLFDGHMPPREPTVYVCAQEIAHQRTGWAEHEPIFAMGNAPATRQARYDDGDLMTLRDRMRSRLVEHGILDPGDAIVWERGPRELEARFPDSGGALYGAASHGWSAAFRRTPNAIAALPGLFVASGSAHPGGGLPLAALSGRAAARAALRGLP